LLVSPQHRILLADWRISLWFGAREALAAAVHLVDGAAVRRVECASLRYVHLLLARHEVLNAEGAAAESLHLGPYTVGSLLGPSRREVESLFPELAKQRQHGFRTARRCLSGREARMIAAHPLAA
ncbi:MAG: Hint domain-containing protein, partial [Thermohalobaculum sp.]|nr:Hint domain-containing protein [Thermohalobaculum sp.]